MPKNILIFSDGTGQRGGLRPDQRLSNIYKMYRAMRPGPDSPILPFEQVAFYDPGLGASEEGSGWFRRLQLKLAAAVGEGIDDNVIDCYEKIIAYYDPGDRIFLFGFSRGAYTVRSVANVMTLCGVPTRLNDGAPVPRYGPRLRKIATDAVKYVYNHGAGKPRDHPRYARERAEKGRRFRAKYGSAPPEGEPDVRGNVRPHFIGAFDTVAALDNALVTWVLRGLAIGALGMLGLSYLYAWPWPIWLPVAAVFAGSLIWYGSQLISQYKYFFEDPDFRPQFWNPLHWPKLWTHGHRAVWSKMNYDSHLDLGVGFARHALAIDEARRDFTRVEWGAPDDVAAASGRTPRWLDQVWFAGCHSDVGGSYPEPESRLSDIALDWMVGTLQTCAPDVPIRDELLVRAPDPLGLQHAELYKPVIRIPLLGSLALKWKTRPRVVPEDAPLHPSVLDRLTAPAVPQMGQVEPYRPPQLADHPQAAKFFRKP